MMGDCIHKSPTIKFFPLLKLLQNLLLQEFYHFRVYSHNFLKILHLIMSSYLIPTRFMARRRTIFQIAAQPENPLHEGRILKMRSQHSWQQMPNYLSHAAKTAFPKLSQLCHRHWVKLNISRSIT